MAGTSPAKSHASKDARPESCASGSPCPGTGWQAPGLCCGYCLTRSVPCPCSMGSGFNNQVLMFSNDLIFTANWQFCCHLAVKLVALLASQGSASGGDRVRRYSRAIGRRAGKSVLDWPIQVLSDLPGLAARSYPASQPNASQPIRFSSPPEGKAVFSTIFGSKRSMVLVSFSWPGPFTQRSGDFHYLENNRGNQENQIRSHRHRYRRG